MAKQTSCLLVREIFGGRADAGEVKLLPGSATLYVQFFFFFFFNFLLSLGMCDVKFSNFMLTFRRSRNLCNQTLDIKFPFLYSQCFRLTSVLRSLILECENTLAAEKLHEYFVPLLNFNSQTILQTFYVL